MIDDFLPAFLIGYSDSGFTNPHEVVRPDEPKDCREDFTHIGKKYWGFETDRHKAMAINPEQCGFSYNHDAYHWMRIGFKKRVAVSRITVSTKWYTGNQVRAVSVVLIDEFRNEEVEVLSRADLQPDSEHEFAVPEAYATECLLKCYYEGGIARVNFFGEAASDQPLERSNILASAKASHISNDHYGTPQDAVAGVRAQDHMVGWESARTGFGERALFHLEKREVVEEVVVDTYLHRLNPPLACCVFGAYCSDVEVSKLMERAPGWKVKFQCGKEVIPENFQAYMLNQKYLREDVVNPRQFEIALHLPEESGWKALVSFGRLHPDTYHRFAANTDAGEVSHLLYMHFPNGGIHGLKAFALP